MTQEKILPIEKDQICDRIYSEYIVKAADILGGYELRANTVEILLPTGCYTNFRDALFHFRKLVSSSEETEIQNQTFAIQEHLSRSLADAACSMTDHSSFVAEKLIKDESIEDGLKCRIRKHLHAMKQAILRKRFEGMMFSDHEMKIAHEEMIDLIDQFYRLANQNCKKEFARYSEEYKLYSDDE